MFNEIIFNRKFIYLFELTMYSWDFNPNVHGLIAIEEMHFLFDNIATI